MALAWGVLRPHVPSAMVRARNLLSRPPDRLLSGLQHRHRVAAPAAGNDALEEQALCLLADLILVLATMEANDDSR